MIGRYLLVLLPYVFFWRDFFFWRYFFFYVPAERERKKVKPRKQERKKIQLKKTRRYNKFILNFKEKIALTKRTGENEYKIKKTKKINQIYFLISRKKLPSPPTTTSYYR